MSGPRRAGSGIAENSPSAARQAWIYVNRLFGWALNRDTYGLTTSPCERINITDLVGSPKPRERILADDELQLIWRVTEDGHFPAEYLPHSKVGMAVDAMRQRIKRARKEQRKLRGS
jgi:hypothetical protein